MALLTVQNKNSIKKANNNNKIKKKKKESTEMNK